LDLRKLHPWKTHFMSSGERVKLRLFQALTRDARTDSNSISAIQISSLLSSHYDPSKLVAATRITNINILNNLDHKLFTIIINESYNVSVKEKMILILYHVDVKECVCWMFFFCIVHVENTTTLLLKDEIEALFAIHGLSISCLRGQG
jgi:hypothetical protein